MHHKIPLNMHTFFLRMHQLIEITIALEFLIRVDLAFRHRILSFYLGPKSS